MESKVRQELSQERMEETIGSEGVEVTDEAADTAGVAGTTEPSAPRALRTQKRPSSASRLSK